MHSAGWQLVYTRNLGLDDVDMLEEHDEHPCSKHSSRHRLYLKEGNDHAMMIPKSVFKYLQP